MASGDVELLQLRRYDTSQPWGFRMQGGSEYNMPLYVAQVTHVCNTHCALCLIVHAGMSKVPVAASRLPE